MSLEIGSLAAFSGPIYNLVKDMIVFLQSKKTIKAVDPEKCLQNHILEIEKWSSRVQFVGMPQALETDNYTSKIRLTSNPRRFYKVKNESVLNECEITNSTGHVVVLGDPGSGKTTAVKRIIRSIIYDEQPADSLQIDFPLLIIARELDQHSTLLPALCGILGIRSELPPAPSTERTFKSTTKENAEYIELIKRYSPRNDYLDILDNFLADKNFLIVIDGLDEVSEAIRPEIEADLQLLSRRLRSGKIICTCRSGDYFTEMDGFDVFEILPLNNDEQRDIIEKWCDDSSNFTREISNKTYADLATKPLYICQLILVFNVNGSLPESGLDIYREIIYLMMERWDKARGINRKSRYSKFSIDKRIQFFAKISLELYKRQGVVPFSEEILLPIYFDIRKSFGLPREEAKDVIQELENHHGIIVQTSHNKYDFSHLSLREYFAALDLILQGDVNRSLEMLSTFPHVVAMATCLASDSGFYLAQILRSAQQNKSATDYGRFMSSYINRLLVEKPGFAETAHLGMAILLLLSDEQETAFWAISPLAEDSIRTLLRFEGIRESLSLVLAHYEFQNDGLHCEFRLHDGVYDSVAHFPERIIVSAKGRDLLAGLDLEWLIDL